MLNKVVFFDVDGVIRYNNTNGKEYPYYCLDYKDVKYKPDIFEVHKFFQGAGYKIFWVIMQNCIKEGKITEQKVGYILQSMFQDFENKGIHITDYQICISKDETDKSKTESKIGAVNKLSMIYNIDLSKSIGIGDRKHDIFAYKECGIPTRTQVINPFGDRYILESSSWYEHSPIQAIKQIFSIHNLDDLFDCYKQVDKLWGREYWIVNDTCGNYCSKILKLIPDHKASLHYHKEKHETFTILSGLARITSNGVTVIYSKGESVCIEPKIPHTFEAYMFPAYILETSTLHSDDDVVRLEVSR